MSFFEKLFDFEYDRGWMIELRVILAVLALFIVIEISDFLCRRLFKFTFKKKI